MKKKIGRRGFLGFMAAAPMAAKGASVEAAQQLSGYSVASSGLAKTAASDPFGASSTGNLTKAAVKTFFGGKVPQFKIDEWKHENMRQGRVGADIAVLRSVSLTSKYRMQQNEYIRARTENFFEQFDRKGNAIRQEFQQKFGWWL